MMKIYRLFCGLALSGLLCIGTASAGGVHYTISASTHFYTDQAGQLAGMHMNWVYDPEVSAFILDGRDTSAAGLAQVAEDILADLDELNYFTALSIAGAPVSLSQVSEYSIKLTDQQGLQLGFQLPLAQAVAVDGKTFELVLSDPDATADINYNGVERLRLAESLAEQCAAPTLQGRSVAAAEHELTVQTVTIACE